MENVDGYGSGDGYGDGSGYGYGYGSGDGSGYGSGYGYCHSDYWSACIDQILVDAEDKTRAIRALREGAVLAYWRSNADGFPRHGGISSHAASPGLVQKGDGPLRLCHRGTLHATLHPMQWAGERLWIVALYPPVVVENDKLGSLKRQIICEVVA